MTHPYWDEIERAVERPDRLRQLQDEIERSAFIESDEKNHMLGRIQRYLDDHARAHGRASDEEAPQGEI